MRKKDFQSLINKHLLSELSGYLVQGDLLFSRPLDAILRGFCFEGSGFDKKSFTVYAFVLPLYVPLGHIAFMFGDRLGCVCGVGDRWWTLADDNEPEIMQDVLKLIRAGGIPFIDTWKLPRDFVEKGNPFSSNPDDHGVLETIVYSAVLIDQSAAAHEAFERLKAILEGDDRFESVEWLRQTLGRAQFLLDTYRRSHDSALTLLNRWRAETLRDLRLTKYAEPPPVSLA